MVRGLAPEPAFTYEGRMRIVSLLPSATEILFALGCGDDVVGVAHECDHPPEARSRRIVSTSALPDGATPAEVDRMVKERIAAGEDLYQLGAGAFADIDPDLVLTQDLCAVCAVDVSEVDQALAHLACSAEVVTLDPMSIEGVLTSIGVVGAATGRVEEAHDLVGLLRRRLSAAAALVADLPPRPTFLLEWTDPAFIAGHWVPDMIEGAGGHCLLGRPGDRSVGVEWAEVSASGAEVVIVSPCGYRLDGAAELARQVDAQGVLPPGAEVWAIDADAFVVRPGPRIVDGVEVIASILHPDRCGPADPTRALRIA
jgi:iron complex transport system substrate-binding protein